MAPRHVGSARDSRVPRSPLKGKASSGLGVVTRGPQCWTTLTPRPPGHGGRGPHRGRVGSAVGPGPAMRLCARPRAGLVLSSCSLHFRKSEGSSRPRPSTWVVIVLSVGSRETEVS